MFENVTNILCAIDVSEFGGKIKCLNNLFTPTLFYEITCKAGKKSDYWVGAFTNYCLKICFLVS